MVEFSKNLPLSLSEVAAGLRQAGQQRSCLLGGGALVKTKKRSSFLTDIHNLLACARQHIEEGALTPGSKAEPAVIQMLNALFVSERVWVFRYECYYLMAAGISSENVQAKFLQYAIEEQSHGDQIAELIIQLGGKPDCSPEGFLRRSYSAYIENTSLIDMIEEDLIAARIVIESYGVMIHYFGNDNLPTRRLLEEILATEEDHAEGLGSILEELYSWRT
jgi:bacterioferritin